MHFLLCVLSDQLYICSYTVHTGLLFQWCESTAAIACVSEEYLVSYCTMERRQDGLPANRIRNRRQRGRNPPWLCDCRCNVRLRVLRQNQVSRSASGDYSCIARVGSYLTCCAVSSRTPPVSFPRTFCCVTGHPLVFA